MLLRGVFAHDADRLARFTREARDAGRACIHPQHRRQIYGVEEGRDGAAADRPSAGDGAGGRREPRRSHRPRAPFPLHEALPIAGHIAEAPTKRPTMQGSFIAIETREHQVDARRKGQVLDFGLAKAFDQRRRVRPVRRVRSHRSQ